MKAMFASCLLLCSSAMAYTGPMTEQQARESLCNGLPAAAQREVIRRGCHVEHVTGGYESTLTQAWADANKPPADDSHKWFITVFTTQGCDGCEALKKAFATDETLRAWVNTDNPKESAVHYKAIDVKDATQEWRASLVKLGVKQYPAILIQPPLNGKFGEASTCLPPIYGFTSAADTANKIRDACRGYIESYQKPSEVAAVIKNRKPPFVWPDTPADDLKKTILSDQPTENLTMFMGIETAISSLMTTFSTPGGLQLLAAIALAVWLPYRNHLRLIGKTPWLDDATYNQIVNLLQTKNGAQLPS
jgi:glutaredoxin